MGKWTRRAFIGAGALAGGGFVLGVTGASFAPSRHSVRSDDAEAHRRAQHLDPRDARQHRHRAGAALRDGPGRADGAGDDGGRRNGRRLESRARQGGAGARRLRQRLHRRAFIDTCPDRSSAASTTAPIVSRAWRACRSPAARSSVRSTGQYGMRVAGAAARKCWSPRRPQQFGVSASECTVANSRVTHAASGPLRDLSASSRGPRRSNRCPSHPALKDPNAYTLRRTSRPRLDMRSKVDGSAIYGIDFTMPGMLHAAVEIAPVFGGKLVSVDTAAGREDAGRQACRASSKRPSRSSPTPTGRRARRWRRSSRSSMMPGTARCRARRSSRRSTRRSAPPPEMPAGAHGGEGRLPRAVSSARDDGADGVHGAGDRRSRGGVGRHAGSAERAQHRGESAGYQRRPRCSSRTSRSAAASDGSSPYLRLRRHHRAHRQGDVAGAGEVDLEPRDRHAARLLPAGGDGALCRRARRHRRAGRGVVLLRGRRRRRIDVHAVCHRREERRRHATPSTMCAPGHGDRCSIRNTASSRNRSSTRWRTPRRRTRSSSGAT